MNSKNIKILALCLACCFMAIFWGCSDSSTYRPPELETEQDVAVLNISGELSFNGIGFLYEITEHNANIADKKRFSVKVEDSKVAAVQPDSNGAFNCPPVITRPHFTVFAENITEPNLVFEATVCLPEQKTGPYPVNISLVSTAQSLIARYLMQHYGRVIAPETISSSDYMATSEAIAKVLENEQSFQRLRQFRLSEVPEIKAAYTAAGEKLNSEKQGSIECDRVIFIYMAGDDRYLAKGIERQLDQIKEIGQRSRTQVLILSDLYQKGGMKVFRLAGHSLQELEDFGKQDSTNPGQLEKFLTKYRRMYPAAKYSLVLAGHGNFWKPNLMFPRPAGNQRFWLFIDEDADYLPRYGSFTEVAAAVNRTARSFDKTLRPYDLLIFDTCSMASIETLCEFKDSAEFMIFSQTLIPADGIPLKKLLTMEDMDSREVGLQVCRDFKNKHLGSNGMMSCISMADCSKLDEFISKFNTYLEVMIKTPGYAKTFGNVAGAIENKKPDGSVNNYQIRGFDGDNDIRDLGYMLKTFFRPKDDILGLGESYNACEYAQKAYNDMIAVSYDHNYQQASGCCITLPTRDSYRDNYNLKGYKYHCYFDLKFCKNTKWQKLLDNM